MFQLGAIHHHEIRRSLVVHLASASLAVICALSATEFSLLKTTPVVAFSMTLAGMLVGCVLLSRRMSRLLLWENRLSLLAQLDDQHTNPFNLQPAGGNSPADFGWNRLLELGKKWQALSQLESSIESRLEACNARVSPPLLDALSDGVATVDSSGVITYGNSVLAAICGVESSESLIGRPLVEAVTSDAASAAIIQTANSQTSVEWKVNAPSGQRILSGRFRPGRKSDSASFAYVWTIRDVTQQRLAEAMRDQFLTTATHEFRTPLANIRAYAESLGESSELDVESRKRFYNVIQSESVRLSQLVDDLLDISRMQAGALSLDPAETDLTRLIEEVTAKVQGEIQSKAIDFQCELPPKLPPKILVDKSKISAALVNLLGNATKYTPQNGKVIFRVDLSPTKLQFQISDTGIGIAPDELPHVFERFYRSNDDRVRQLSGSGLGLALTQEVARLHGGDVSAESQLDQGSTFCLSIPLDNSTAA